MFAAKSVGDCPMACHPLKLKRCKALGLAKYSHDFDLIPFFVLRFKDLSGSSGALAVGTSVVRVGISLPQLRREAVVWLTRG
jgi:hypothetical protein